MIIVYLIVVCVSWIILKVTTNYKILLFCRRFLDVSFYIVCILYSIFIVFLYSGLALLVKQGGNPGNTAKSWGAVIGVYCMIPLLFRFWRWLFHIRFYNSSHIRNLDKYTLYLRSFKDDKKKVLTGYRLMDSLYKYLYAPFAVGRPNEMKPSSHTIPLYIGDDWKNQVMVMMIKAPLILLRVSDTAHFLWELGTCVKQNHIHKSLFWITDIQAYMSFKQYCFEKYGLSFPEIEKISKNCMIFHDGQEFQVCHLTNKKSYKSFCFKIFDVLNLKNDDYFYGRKKFFGVFFRFHNDDNVSIGVQRWDWIAFLFPEFYLMFHRFGWTRLILLILEGYAIGGGFMLLCSNFNLSLYSFLAVAILFRLPFMFLFGKNARSMEWYEEKWEGITYFNKISLVNNIKTLAYAVGFFVLFLLAFIFIL